MAAPTQLPAVYATDEKVAIRCTGDFSVLCPTWQKLAAGTDGVIASNAPWTLSSASNVFESQGVQSQHVILLTQPKTAFQGGGELFAVDSVASNTLVLRRLGKGTGVGCPPIIGGASSIQFLIKTLDPQIEDVSFELNRQFGIDNKVPLRNAQWVYDLDENNVPRDLRQLCILKVLERQYAQQIRTDSGDFKIKLAEVQMAINELIPRVSIRWGPYGNSSAPNNAFNARITR